MEKKNLAQFLKQSGSSFFEATFNLFIFLPYYFSIGPLFRTLLSPWKNLIVKKTQVGFSFNDWASRLSFNLISRFLGFMMRGAIIIFFLLLEAFLIISFPLAILIFFLLLPLNFLIYSFKKSDEERRLALKQSFISTHLLKQENLAKVQDWFEKYYQLQHVDYHWWQLKNLLATPPLARDWAVGFTPTLDQYVEELTTSIYQNRVRSTIDREKEIKEIETVLSKNEEANVLITGEEGVGKHSIIDALAKRIYEGSINQLLIYKRILKLNLEKILTQFTDQKQRESRLEELFAEAVEAKNIILMIENLDKYVSSSTDTVNLSLPIEKYGLRSGLNFIATTTPFAYQKFIFSNTQINRIFTKIDVAEVDKDDAEKILLEKALLFERKNKVIIPYETVKNTIEKSDFFITSIPFPEKAIELLDNACAYVSRINKAGATVIVTPDFIDTIITEMTHVPTKLDENLRNQLVGLDKQLGERILFQEEAVKKLTGAIQKAFLMLGRRKKPLTAFLFLGPTGVGKTETAKALTQIFFGDEKYLLRFDMSLYQSKNDIPNLIGSLESQTPGLLTKAIRENPYGVLLLDEIEKANKDLLNIFLTILDEGYFTDGAGRRVDCKNLMIIATSNAGSDYIFKTMFMRGGASGGPPKTASSDSDAIFGGNSRQDPSSQLINYLIEQKYFAPEFLNRFDGVIAYNPLTQDVVTSLARRIVTRIADNYSKLYKVTINISDQTLTDTVRKGYRPEFGARDLERVITEELEDKVAKQILEGRAQEGQIISL